MDYLEVKINEINQRIEEIKPLLDDPDIAELAKQEIADLKAQLPSSSLLPQSPINPNVAIMEIRSAAGGDEAGLFANDLFRMYTKFAENNKWSVEELDRSEGKLGQIKEIILKIKGQNVYNSLKYESGVHRVQRVPQTESSGRIHTSTVTVVVLPQVSQAQITINPAEIEFE